MLVVVLYAVWYLEDAEAYCEEHLEAVYISIYIYNTPIFPHTCIEYIKVHHIISMLHSSTDEEKDNVLSEGNQFIYSLF